MADTIAPPAPPTEEELQKQLQVQVVDLSSGVQANAIDRAEAHIDEQTTEGGIKGTFKRIWHGNIARDYIRQREIRRGTAEIVESGNLYALDDASQAEHDTAAGAVVNRFTEDFIHEGETNRDLADVEHGEELTGHIKDLVSSFVRGDLDITGLQEEKTRLLNLFSSVSQEQDRKKGLLFADNILQVAANAKAAFEHGVALDRIEAALSAKTGEARMGVRTEARRDAADRVFEKIQGTRVGSLVNETTMGVGIGEMEST